MPDTPVLVLSDLGCLDSSDVRCRQWRRLGVRLRRAGRRPVALMPCPPRCWDRELTRLFFPVCWDRAARPPRRIAPHRALPGPTMPTATARDAAAEWLLTLLAPAIRVEPALLRAVRYLLPAHMADVGSEAAAWNHPHVHATPLAFYYDHGAADDYRDRFKQLTDTALRQQVAALIRAHHAHLSPIIGHEERARLVDLTDASEPDEESQRYLARLVKTLCTREGALMLSAQAWTQRMERRQHASMWQNEVLAAVWMAAQQSQDERLGFPLGLELRQVSWLLPRDPEPKSYTLRQRG